MATAEQYAKWCLMLIEGQAVRSRNNIYMVESDYIKLKDWLDKTGDA